MKQLALLTGILFLLLGCQSAADLDTPPEILYGQDICDECSMIINETRYAASYVTNTGEVRRFDGIGDMLLYDYKQHEQVHVYWVHDFNSEEWLLADKATFVQNSALPTPMGWGLIAFADPATAADYVAANGGSTATLADLQQLFASGAVDPTTLHDAVIHHDENTQAQP
ncbi:MAG: nitrous oxide reductase accessory protein NosL [Anaerolineales bacterium]|nr:nitrous oxide reductase accessory protein NosL [Anaerolineales bacterium]